MSIRYDDYVRVCQAVRCAKTEREIVAATGFNYVRVREVCDWLHEHDVISRALLGTRLDPHDNERRIPIYSYAMIESVEPEDLIGRLKRYFHAKKNGNTKAFDASALVSCWGGVASCPGGRGL